MTSLWHTVNVIPASESLREEALPDLSAEQVANDRAATFNARLPSPFGRGQRMGDG